MSNRAFDLSSSRMDRSAIHEKIAAIKRENGVIASARGRQDEQIRRNNIAISKLEAQLAARESVPASMAMA